jgi:signal transduction histidine kinase/CheY-like chemotaxis protein
MTPGDDRERIERRVLVLAPTGKDAALTEAILGRAGLDCLRCADLGEVCAALPLGAGAVLLVEEAVAPGRGGRLCEWLERQPPWSDLPLLVLARPGADSAAVAQAMDQLGNVTVLERPLRVAALVSVVRTALRARERQYEARAHFAELREADRRKDEFLAVLAHELRNPLAPIRNGLELLRLSGRPDAPVLEMMERQVAHMVRLVDDLMEVSRITRGKIDLRKAPVALDAILRAAVETSRPAIEAAGHRLALELPAAPVTLDGDAIRLTQVVANLLNNSAKYTDAGGDIRLAARRRGGEVEISVRDTGWGIPPDMLAHVFDPFRQIERPGNRGQSGLGMGLTLVKRLVELHGGSVRVASEGEGRGSEFVVRLPVAAGARAAASAAQPAARAGLGSRGVLVVDDNRDAADSLGSLLGQLGADVHVVYSGADALEAMRTYRPSVVLLDIGMPGMDGHEVARRIRSRPDSQDVTLIALTGWGQEQERHRARASGFDHHLIKPADLGALESLLRG